MRERFIATAPRDGERIRAGKGLFVVESECPQFLRTVPVLTRDKRHPEKYGEGEDHLGGLLPVSAQLRFDTGL